MSSTADNPPLKMRAKMAAADPNCTVVALAELPAAKVSFQRITPSHPPTQNDDSAALPVLPAGQFSGKSSQILQFVQIMHKSYPEQTLN